MKQEGVTDLKSPGTQMTWKGLRDLPLCDKPREGWSLGWSFNIGKIVSDNVLMGSGATEYELIPE